MMLPTRCYATKRIVHLPKFLMNEPFPVCTWTIIAVTSLASWFGFRSSLVEERYIFEPQAILAWKQYHRLITSAFLHADWRHLILNMLTLYLFGRSVELRVGPGELLAIYFGAIVGGSLLALYVHRHHEYRAYGASGGVCGIIFAHILLFPGTAIYQYPVPFAIPAWLYLVIFMSVSFVGMKNNKDNIGHDAHLGGAIVGLLVAAGLHPESARDNWKIFLLMLGSALLLLTYLWVNPLFLPLHGFWEGRFRKRSAVDRSPAYKRESLEMDAILEKINARGMDSLSAQEKEFLQSVSGKYQRRAESEKPQSGLAI